MRRWAPLAAAAGLSAAVTLGTLGLLEVGFRLFKPQDLQPPSVSRYGILYAKPSYETFRHRSPRFDVEYRTDRHGFRGQDYDFPKPAGVKRVLLLGDSYTWGWGVPFDKTYGRLLEEGLRARGRRVEVVNLGLVGVGLSVQEYLYRRIGRLFSPDVVTVAFISNDLDYDFFKRKDGPQVSGSDVVERVERGRGLVRRIPGYAWLCRHSHLFAFLRMRLSALVLRAGREQLDAQNEVRGDPERRARQQAEGVKTFDALIDAVCGRGGSVVVLDTDEFLRRFTLVYGRLKERAAADPRCLRLARVETAAADLFGPEDPHWNESGNAKAAAALLREVEPLLFKTPGR